MIKKYRKKPVVIEAVQYDGTNVEEIKSFARESAKYTAAVGSSDDGKGGIQSYSKLEIITLEGAMLVSEGDYVIKGVKGEFYPCKQGILAMSYDEVNE